MSNADIKRKVYDLSSMRVLLFDQFPFMAGLMSSMLKEFNVKNVMTSETIKEAQSLLERSNMYGPPSGYFDLLVTDWMPRAAEGIELLKWARGHSVDGLRYLPILFCTGYTHQRAIERIRDSGSTEVLRKPVSAKKLAQRLTYIIDAPRPFIRSRHYLGPDRRRSTDLKYEGKERRDGREEDNSIEIESANN